MPAIGTGSTGASISSASQTTAVSASSAGTRRSYRGPVRSARIDGVAALSTVGCRLPFLGDLRLAHHVTGAGPGAHVRLVHADEDPAEAAVPFRIARRVAERVLAGELLRDGAVHRTEPRHV